MALTVAVDRRAVLSGAVLALALAVPTVVGVQAYNALVGIPDDSNLWFAAAAVLFVEMMLGGSRAARLRLEAPFTHGAMAALLGYVPILVISLAVALVKKPISANQIPGLVSAVLFGLLLFASAGIFGGLLATRPGRGRRRHRPGSRSTDKSQPRGPSGPPSSSTPAGPRTPSP